MAKLDKDTLLPASVFGTLLLLAITCSWWLRGELLNVTHELRELRLELTASRTQTRQDFESWTRLLRADNPTLKVPEFR